MILLDIGAFILIALAMLVVVALAVSPLVVEAS